MTLLLISLFCAKTSIVYFPLLLLPLPEREHIYTIQRFSCLNNFSNTTVNEEKLNFKTDKFLFKNLDK